MTDSDLNFLIAVIGCMLAVFWVIGRIWLAIAGRGSSSFGRSVAVRRSVVARPVAGIPATASPARKAASRSASLAAGGFPCCPSPCCLTARSRGLCLAGWRWSPG